MMRTNPSALLRRAIGDVVAVEIESGLFCYVRKFAFGHGVLPFFSTRAPLPLERFPTVKPALFMDIWVYRDDPTPAHFIASVPFERVEESWGEPAFEPPDAIEPCFKIHGVFNGVTSIIKAAEQEQTAGMRQLRRYQPAEFGAFLASNRGLWPVIAS